MKFFGFTLIALSYSFQLLLNSVAAEPLAKENRPADKLGNLHLNVQRIKNVTGKLHYQLLSCPKNETIEWKQLNMVHSGSKLITKQHEKLSFGNIREGRYIVRIFQDINKNHILDYSSNNIPKEPTGFSNNPNIFLGEPIPFDTCFEYKDGSSVTIKMNNKRKNNRRRHKQIH